MLKQTIKRAFHAIGLDVRRTGGFPQIALPVEFTKADEKVLEFVLRNQLSMVSRERLIATINACKHAVEAGIDGDFVECGVWRGGNSIAAKLTFENYGSDKKVWLFDTFAGMTDPTDEDRAAFVDIEVRERFEQSQTADHNEWCYASLEDVRRNFEHGRRRNGWRSFHQGRCRGDVLPIRQICRRRSAFSGSIPTGTHRRAASWRCSTRDLPRAGAS